MTVRGLPSENVRSDSQPFAAFGASGIDDGTSTAGFHANQKAVGARTAGFRRLVRAFHGLCLGFKGKPCIISVFSPSLANFRFRCDGLPKKSHVLFQISMFLWIIF